MRTYVKAILVAAVCLAPGALLLGADRGAPERHGPRYVVRPGLPQAEAERIRRGYEIAPVPLDVAGKDPLLVGLGSYIVNAQAVCADCHSCPTYTPGHNPFPPTQGDGEINPANYLAGGVPFGPFLSANLTPDPARDGLPAGLTRDEFFDVMRHGHDPGGNPLFVMPWPIFRNMLDRDLDAIYAYLSSIPHAEPGTCGGPGE